MAPFAQDSLAAPASQAYVERVFSVCGHLTSGKRKSTERFWKWTMSFTIDCIWLSNITLCTYTTETRTETEIMIATVEQTTCTVIGQ